MDDIFDKLRARWNDPEFVQSLAKLDQEPIAETIKREKRRERREKQWRIARRIILRVPLMVFLALAGLRLFAADRHESPMQSVAFILELAVLCGLNPLEKARAKYEQPKFWLNRREFLQDEQHRLSKNIQLDKWASLMVAVAVAGVGMYLAPLLPPGLQIACLAVTGAAIVVLLVYVCHKISQLKRWRDKAAADLVDLLGD
jgi:membrane protein YdbS with pleckstrin-like domain